jgi:hypothetical protein
MKGDRPSEGGLRNLLRQVGAVLGKTLEIFKQGKAGFASPAQLVLGGNELKSHRPIVAQCRIAGQVFFSASGFAGFQSKLKVDMHQLNQNPRAEPRANRQEFIDGGPWRPAPCLLKIPDRFLQRRPILRDL